MSSRAWAYLWAVLLVAVLFIGAAFISATPPFLQMVTLGVLVVLATLAQLVKVEGPNHMAFFTTPVYLFAGVILLSPACFIVLVALPHLIEWARARIQRSQHLRAWYIQPFNIAKHIIAGSVAQWVYATLQDSISLAFFPSALLALAITALTYLIVSEYLLGQVLVLARGVSWRESGVLATEHLLLEFMLLCVGASAAMLWRLDPWLIVLALAPLGLMYRALMVPKLKEEAQTDGKTGLFNARHFNRRFTDELERARRFNRPLAFIMADLDLLRNINNTYGHLAGDAVLEGIGKIIRKTIRDYDIAGRFGGEEFAIVLPEAGPVEAQLLAERIRHAIESASFTVSTIPNPIRATMSFGVACFPDDAATLTDLTHEADVAVYQAKLQGRNRVVSAAGVPQSIKLEHAAASEAKAPRNPAASTPQQQVAAAPPPAATQPPVKLVVADDPHASHRSAAKPEEAPPRVVVATSATSPAAKPVNWMLGIFVSTVIAAGLGMTLFGATLNSQPDLVALALLIGLAVMAELMQINVYGENTISVSLAALIAAGLIAGIPGVAIVSAAIALAHRTRHRWTFAGLYKTAFNWSTHLLAGSVPVFAIGMQAIPYHPANVLPLGILTIISALVYYVVETGLISAAIALSRRASILETWCTQFRWLVGHYLALGIMGLFLGIAYAALGLLGIVAFALPVFMLRYAQQQYVARTEHSVRELKRMNTELAGANREVVNASFAIQQLNGQLKYLNDELFLTLGTILDARDPYVVGHAAQVARLATAIAREFGFTEERIELIRQAAFLHDIGKIAIAEQILHKPDRLTDDEYETIKEHARIGAELLETSQGLRHLAAFVRHHHERWDGRGYPDGLQGEQIPLEARILNVCDSVEAMVSDRPYHKGMSLDEVIAEVRRCAGKQFDPSVSEVFIGIVEREGEHFVVNSAVQVAQRHTQRRRPELFQSQMMYMMKAGTTQVSHNGVAA